MLYVLRDEQSRLRRVRHFDMRIRQIRLATFSGNGAHRLHEHAFRKFLYHIWLMEPHNLDRARRVGDNGFPDRDLAFPRTSGLEFTDGSEDGYRCPCGECRDG